MRYSLNDTVNIAGYPTSKVVGIDKYALRSLTGKLKKWTSYTLVSEDESCRWWLSDENAGLYCWLPANINQVKGEIDLSESGLCKLEIQGDSTVSSPYSSVLFYKHGDLFYSLEAFDGDDEVFSMVGKIIK